MQGRERARALNLIATGNARRNLGEVRIRRYRTFMWIQYLLAESLRGYIRRSLSGPSNISCQIEISGAGIFLGLALLKLSFFPLLFDYRFLPMYNRNQGTYSPFGAHQSPLPGTPTFVSSVPTSSSPYASGYTPTAYGLSSASFYGTYVVPR